MSTSFQKKVFSTVKKIPEGRVMTYKEVALAIGHPGAARAVGSALNKNYDPRIPCHRVIRSNGSAGEYNRGAARKKLLLKREGAL